MPVETRFSTRLDRISFLLTHPVNSLPRRRLSIWNSRRPKLTVMTSMWYLFSQDLTLSSFHFFLYHLLLLVYFLLPTLTCRPGSSVGIAKDYGLDGPGSYPGGDESFRPSRPALGLTQPPLKLVPGLSRGKVRLGRDADHSPPSSAAVMEE